MKKKLILGVSALALLASPLIGVYLHAQESGDTSSLSPVMRKNFISLIELEKLAADSKQFDDPKNYKKIAAALATLEQSTKHITKILSQQQKSGLVSIAEIYDDYVGDMAKRFKDGHKGYVRHKVGTVSQLCLSCHTGVATSKQFQDETKSVEAISLTPYQRVHYYAATRQFDLALASMDQIFNQKELGLGELREFTQAVKTALSVVVRVKQSPATGLEVIAKALKKPGVPEFITRDFKQWQKDLKAWKKEKPPSKPTIKDLIASARQLIESAQKIQEYPTDHSTDVRYLRASNALQQALQLIPNPKQQAEAFYLLGRAYASLRDNLLWNLDQYYYEACIKRLPHSSMAQKCYKTLSSEIFFGYTGSAGTLIPAEEIQRLDRLQKMVN